VLDSAGYGVVTIHKSVTITNPGGIEAGITTTSGENAITIDATSGITVTLRGLTLEGGGVGVNGIILQSTAGGTLNIIDCVVKDFTDSGITIQPQFSSGVQTEYVVIANTFALDNAANGIELFPQTGLSIIDASIYQTTVNGNANGITVGSNAGQTIAFINNSHVDTNILGIYETSIGTTTLKNSTVQNSTADGDINSTGAIYFYNNNTIGDINDQVTCYTDGTNNIGVNSGAGSLTKLALQ
jgi:hypothetical protein